MNLEQRFFNLSPDLYCVVDIHGFIQQVNPAFEKMLGFAAFEILAQPYLALVHLDDVPATIKALEALKRGISTRYHNRYRCKDGSEKFVEWIAEPAMEEGVEERLIYMVGRDVTAQKRLLEEQERFFTVGADLLSIGTFDGVLTWVSPSWEKTLGWTKEELTAYPWLHFVHPEDHEKTQQAGQELLAGVELISFENRYLCKDGSYRWISWRSRPFPDERLIYGAAVDITERKLAESLAQEALKESEERYRTFVNTVSSIVWTTNGEGFIVAENPLWGAFTGQTWEEYKDWGWLNAIHPDDQAQTREVYKKSLQEGSLYETKYRIKRYDGEYRYVVARGAAVITADGSIREWVGTCTDIHDSKLIADALQQSQERLELSFRKSPIILYTCDTELRYTWVGKAHPNFNPQDMLGKRDDELLPLEMVQELMAFKRRVIESGKTGRETLRFEISGKLNIYDITAEPLYENGDDTALVGLTVTALDVTEHQLYEERFRLMANSIPQLAWMAAPDGWIFWYNQRWYDYTGTTFSDMEGWGWQSVHDPEELPKILTRWKHSIDAGEAFDMEFPLKGADGKFRWFLTRAYPQKDSHGRVVLWFGTNTDVTEQRNAREEREQLLKALEQEQVRLRAVLDNIPVAVVLAEGPEGKIVMANKQTEEIFRHPVFYSTDYNSYHEWESYDAEGRRTESHEYPLAKVFATGKPYQNEYHYQRGDATRAWVRIMGAPINDRDGKLIAAVVAITDIDSEKQEQERRERLLESERAARMETERVGKMKDEFLITLSHELRTPLNAILGWSQILRKNNVSADRMQQGLDAIGRNVRNQSQLIEDLLDVSRIISGKIQLNVELVNMASVIEVALETVRLSADAKGIELETTLFDPLSFIVSGDSARLQQIIWNLLSNAIKFTPKKGKVQIVLKRVDSRVQVSVIDTGQGIKPEFLPHVFERFSQADGSTTRKYGGLGLGLSIVQGLTELHGGTVWVTSPGEGMGATFTVSLPIAPIRSNVTSERNSDKNKATNNDEFDYSESLVLSGIKVLVVDDEPDARDIIRCVLEDALANVVTAESAQSALELISRELPDVLVSDIGMPDEDGYELIRKVRSLPSGAGGRIPAVALTAYARAEDRKRALLAGYQMHISKPVEASELIAIVSSLTSLMGKRG